MYVCIISADLGSYMGLLMGCSLLTMVEVVDLFVYYTIVKIIERYQDRKPKRRETIEIKLWSITFQDISLETKLQWCNEIAFQIRLIDVALEKILI